jgi:hypothetical protein
MSREFYQTVEKILVALMIGLCTTLGIGFGVRSGSDPMREEFIKFRVLVEKLLEDHEQRLSNVERLTNTGR